MRLALRLGLSGLVITAVTASVMSPRPTVAAAAGHDAGGASSPAASDATNSVMVMYRNAPEGWRAGRISRERLARLRAAAGRMDISLGYDRTMGIGAYVMTLGRTVSGSELDVLTQVLRRADPAVEWVVPNEPVTLMKEALINDPMLPAQWNLDDGPGGIRALDAWDEQWQVAAGELKHGFVPDNGTGPRLVRYGQYGHAWIYKEISGDFDCSPNEFGRDPLPNVKKRCDVATYWVHAADGDQSFNLGRGVSKWVRYGWGENWKYAFVTDHGTCNTTQFGGDPAYGVRKICQVQQRSDGGGVVAAEGGYFNLQQPAIVRYGVLDHWYYKPFPAGVETKCGPLSFGGDPLYGYEKHCEKVKSMGAGVTIAVPDRGSVPHPDLDNKLVSGYNFIDRNADTRDLGSGSAACGNKPDPDNWHGLEVGSVAGAETNNGIGIAGAAPMSNIMMEKLMSCGAVVSSANVADALVWAVGKNVPGVPSNPNPAKVVNLSMGVVGAPCSPPWQIAINEVRSRGGVVVVAAGNLGMDLRTLVMAPTNCTGVIVVSGTDRAGAKVPMSNYGDVVSLSAPGFEVPALSNDGTVVPGAPAIALLTGTSFAAPQVSGVAAMMFGKNPSLTPANVETRLRLSARPFPSPCDGCGTGILDAVNALRSAEAITTESEPNDYPLTANYISAPADVSGRFDAARPDHFSVDLPPGNELAVWVTTTAPGYTCTVDIGVDHYSCVEQMATAKNDLKVTQRVTISLGPTVDASANQDYKVYAMWDSQP